MLMESIVAKLLECTVAELNTGTCMTASFSSLQRFKAIATMIGKSIEPLCYGINEVE